MYDARRREANVRIIVRILLPHHFITSSKEFVSVNMDFALCAGSTWLLRNQANERREYISISESLTERLIE